MNKQMSPCIPPDYAFVGAAAQKVRKKENWWQKKSIGMRNFRELEMKKRKEGRKKKSGKGR